MSFRPHPRYARVDPTNPSAWFTCDRCGLIGNLRDAVWDRQWSGTFIQNRRFLVHPHCYNIPNELLRTIILPPDPPPVLNARVENYGVDEAQGPTEPGFLVEASRHGLRIVLRAPGVRGGARVTSGIPSLQTSF